MMEKLKFFGKGKKHVHEKFTFRQPKHIIIIPRFKRISEVNIRYPLIEPYAYCEIKWVDKEKRLVYNVIEPELSKEEEKILKLLERSLEEIIDITLSGIKNQEKAIEYLQKKLDLIIEDLNLSINNKVYTKIMYYIVRNFVGLNEIEPLMHDPYIEDIGCNGLNTHIYVVHKKFGSLMTNIIYKNEEELSNFVIKLAERCGRYISYASPLLDGSLPDGSRVQASLARDVTTRGPTFSIRRFRSNPYSPVDLIKLGTASVNIMAYMWMIVQYGASILICGGVSSGKTTFLNSISMFIPPEDKIISIEDTREINLPHENWIPAVSRTGFGAPEAGKKRYGEVELFDLLKESFRQNPKYVMVGEVRDKEAYVMFQGIASGHPSMSTIHAGSVEDVMKRLQTPPIELSPSLIEALDVIVIMVNAKREGKTIRRVKEIVEIQNVDHRTGIAHTKHAYTWIPYSDDFSENITESEVLRRISFQEGVSYQKILNEFEKRKKVLEWMVKHNITDYQDFCKIVRLYYRDNESLMRMVKRDMNPFKAVEAGS